MANLIQVMFFPHIIDEAFIDDIVASVIEAVRELDADNLLEMPRRRAQRLIEATARQAVADTWSAAYGKTYKITRTWPQATAILLDNPRRCVVELWIGHEYHADDIPDPIEIFFSD